MTSCKSMGNLGQLAGMMPGDMGKQLDAANLDEKQLGRTRAIIQSMTPLERENPSILNASRKKRIAAGCGLQVVGCQPAAEVRSRCSSSSPSPFPRAALAASEVPAACPPCGKARKGKLQGFGRKKRLK